MTTNRAAHTAKKFLLENPGHLQTALAVHDAWGLVRDQVCRRFLKQLRDEVEDRIRQEQELAYADCHVCCDYDGDKKYPTLSIFREAWMPYKDSEYPEQRSTIRLEAGPGGPEGWYWGVCSPKDRSAMTAREQKRREGLEEELLKNELRLDKRGASDLWPQWEHPDLYRDWYPLVPRLHRECDEGGGTITAYFAKNLLEIAKKAIPAINEVES